MIGELDDAEPCHFSFDLAKLIATRKFASISQARPSPLTPSLAVRSAAQGAPSLSSRKVPRASEPRSQA